VQKFLSSLFLYSSLQDFLCAMSFYTPATFLTTFWNRTPLGCGNKYPGFMKLTGRIIYLHIS
jgi:hypothetical protein